MNVHGLLSPVPEEQEDERRDRARSRTKTSGTGWREAGTTRVRRVRLFSTSGRDSRSASRLLCPARLSHERGGECDVGDEVESRQRRH